MLMSCHGSMHIGSKWQGIGILARNWAAIELVRAVRDQRVVDRLMETLVMFGHPEKTIPQACGSWAGAKAA